MADFNRLLRTTEVDTNAYRGSNEGNWTHRKRPSKLMMSESPELCSLVASIYNLGDLARPRT